MPDFRYWYWRPYGLRGGGGDTYMQVTELWLQANGARITASGQWYNWNVSLTGNSTSNSNADSLEGHGPDKVDDGTNSKWLDTRGAGGGLWRDFGQTIYADQLCWVTGDDATWRDPASWVIYGSNDNSTWTNLWESFDTPTTSRITLAGTWPLSGTKRRPGSFLSFF